MNDNDTRERIWRPTRRTILRRAAFGVLTAVSGAAFVDELQANQGLEDR
jgi:hypothetical protein